MMKLVLDLSAKAFREETKQELFHGWPFDLLSAQSHIKFIKGPQIQDSAPYWKKSKDLMLWW